ncbi:MAG: hypothetical protein EU540_02550 [Promethearchaeota archaeon]|nr:MAG: hypothetical protein EU540_02550 [Candidatus Lokiarchaeota archaeon]
MIKESLPELIIGEFGEKLYKKSLIFPNNKINIIYIREDPIKINSIILDNDREFHLIINQKKAEIFHDCPSFLIHSLKEKKICVHLIKALLLIKKNLALKILSDFSNYKLTSEDFGSKKKSKNYILLSNSCFETDNCVEGLSYLNKAIINQSECESIIENYLKRAIENNLYVEFFEFLKTCIENELIDRLLQFNHYIIEGFENLLNSTTNYSFIYILFIIESLNVIFNFIDLSFSKDLFNKFEKMVYSSNLNEKYFSIYFIMKNFDKLIEINPLFKALIEKNHLESSKNEILEYFFGEIENLAVLDKLKLMKRQFKIIGISKDRFYNEYKSYKNEIKELEKKVYLKKFSFLKLLMEKYNIISSKGEFRKKRNTYIIQHDPENLKNPVYQYIIRRLGFFGLNDQIIKSNDIGINYFIIRELFLDDLTNHPDIFYYKKQFWGDNENDLEINSIEGFSLFSDIIHYNYDIDQQYSNINDVIIIEWDLANKPRQGSIVNAYGSQIIIPDQNNPLFHDLKPFELCYCLKIPVKIEGNIIKTINVISKCSFKDAINSISKGMSFIEGFYPLSLVKAVLDKEISPFKANETAVNNANKIFIPKYNQFIKNFREFLFEFINRERDYIFEEIKSDPEKKANQIIILLNLTNELSGLNLPYSKILKKLLSQNVNLQEFKLKFLKEIHIIIKEILEKRNIGNTIVFDLKKMRNTPFSKYSNEILNIRKQEFESGKVCKFQDKAEIWYDVSEIKNTFYGKKFFNILNIGKEISIKPDKFKKFSEFTSKLRLKINLGIKNH